MNMSVNNANAYFNAARVEQPRISNKENRIKANEAEIAGLENEIAARQDTIQITKELISSNKEKISIMERLKANNERLIGSHKEQRGLLQESRDLTKESRDLLKNTIDLTKESRDLTKESRDLTKGKIDLTQKMIDVTENLIGAMKRLMVLNPAKYGSLENSELQKIPEIKEAKSDIIAAAAIKVEQYPEKEHAALAETVKNVIDTTFSEIKPNDTNTNRILLTNLTKRIEVALDKKHETLSAQDIKEIMNAHYRSVDSFYRINSLSYLDLALKDIEV